MKGILFLAALAIAGLVLAITNFENLAPNTDPVQCPACKREELLRIQASVSSRSPIPLLRCRNCNEAFYWYGGSLFRDTGRPLF